MEKGVDLLYYIEKRNQGKPLAKKIRDEIAKKKNEFHSLLFAIFDNDGLCMSSQLWLSLRLLAEN